MKINQFTSVYSYVQSRSRLSGLAIGRRPKDWAVTEGKIVMKWKRNLYQKSFYEVKCYKQLVLILIFFI